MTAKTILQTLSDSFVPFYTGGPGMKGSLFNNEPSGKVTSLGLSLSYDIVKAHEGAFTVETNEGLGSAFAITLPFNKA
jgi:signal transduction histidine kinase